MQIAKSISNRLSLGSDVILFCVIIKNITTSWGQSYHIRPSWEFYTITIYAYLWNSYHKNFVSQNVDNLYICIGNYLPNHLIYLDIEIEPNKFSFLISFSATRQQAVATAFYIRCGGLNILRYVYRGFYEYFILCSCIDVCREQTQSEGFT